MLRRFVVARPPVLQVRCMAAKKGGKGKGGGGGAAGGGASEKTALGDFSTDEMYPELKLGELTDADVPAWAREAAVKVLEPQEVELPRPGEEDRKHFKLERRERIKLDNARRGMGL